MKHYLLFLLLFISFGQSLQAQYQYFKQYALEEGLPQSEVWALLADSRGHLWLGTNGGGLVRFNGKSCTIFNKRHGFPNEQINSLTEDSDGVIWGNTFTSVFRYDGKAFTHFTNLAGIDLIISGFTQTVDCPADKSIFVLRVINQQQRHVWQYKNDKWQHLNEQPIFKDKNIVNIKRTQDNRVWLLLNTPNQNLYEYKNGEWALSELLQQEALQNKFIVPFYYDTTTKELWIAAQYQDANGQLQKEIYVEKDNTLQRKFFPEKAYPLINNFQNVVKDHSGNFWFLSNNNNAALGVIKVNEQDFINFEPKHGFNVAFVNQMVLDREGNIWIATRGNGILRYSGETFTALNATFGLKDEMVRAIYQDSKGIFWIGSANGGFASFNPKTKELQNYTCPFTIGRISQITEQPDGSLWLATVVGMVKFENGKFTDITTQLGIPAGQVYTGIVKSRNGRDWWFSSLGGGVLRYDTQTKSITQYNTANKKLKTNIVHSIFEDKKGIVWLMTNNGLHKVAVKGLLQNEEEKITVYTSKDGLGLDLVQQMVQDKNDNLWVTTYGGGISRFTGQRFITYNEQNSQLNADLVYSLNQDSLGNLWAGTQKGVSRIAIDEKSEVVNIQNYTQNDGFMGLESNGMATYKDRSNNLWFGTIRGAVQYDFLKDSKEKKQPIVNVTDLKLFFKEVNWQAEDYKGYFSDLMAWFPLPQTLDLPYNQNHVTFNFEAIAYKDADKILYQWKLDGVDKDWTPLIDKTEAVYPNLSPKKYTFQVRATADKGATWSNVQTYSFVVSPPWYATWWFITLSISTVLLISYLSVRWRINAIKERQVELEKLVNEKTAEVRQQRDEILAQSQELQAANTEIRKQSDLLEQKNRDITASINYAKRIQTAMLMGEEDMQKILPESFVLFKPKDIVSGDFYWLEKIKIGEDREKIIVAAVDCTGHGVPGAFMSMIGNDLLNHIVLEKHITESHLILSALHKGVRKSLKQSENRVKDGMDLSLMVFEKENGTITKAHYAGAMNPLYYVPLQQAENFKEIKADKKPIGGNFAGEEEDRTFTNHEISVLATPTTFYLCSDGYQDQFGGERNSKFLVRRFRALLASIVHLPMDEQKNILEKTMTDWLGTHRQIDDVLVLGIKV